jgi:sulfate transport system ATP-binding protein
MEIRIRDLHKSFGKSPTLLGVDIDIASGELLGLLGPSGSGKTTLLRMIAGLETPTAGKIFFGEEDASHKSVQERRVGFVFQSYALFRHMNVIDNISYGLRVRPRGERPAAAEIRKRVDDLIDLMQLGGLGPRYPGQLSGGQRQRVALARALAVEPRVLLLDEPFGALDAQVRRDLRRWLRDIHDRTGHTTVFVTHDQEEALELSDRVAVLNKGRIEQIGTPDEIYDTPATPFVYGFIGDANRVEVHVSGGRIAVNGEDAGPAPEGTPDGPGSLFFRPQHIAFHDGTADALRGTVRAVRRVAASWRAEIELVGGAHVETDLTDAMRLARGETVHLRLRDSRIFPADA